MYLRFNRMYSCFHYKLFYNPAKYAQRHGLILYSPNRIFHTTLSIGNNFVLGIVLIF